MCQKHQHHCSEYCELREEAVADWCNAMALEEVLAIWGRFGGKVTKHRYGRQHYVEAGRKGGVKSRPNRRRS